MDLFRKCMEPVEKCLRDAKMDKSTVRSGAAKAAGMPCHGLREDGSVQELSLGYSGVDESSAGSGRLN